MAESAKLVIDGKEFEFPVVEGSENEISIAFSFSVPTSTGKG